MCRTQTELVQSLEAYSHDEIRAIARTALDRKTAANMLGLNVGDSVTFMGRYGQVKHGVVSRMNRKTATVKTDDSLPWRVPASMLTKVS